MNKEENPIIEAFIEWQEYVSEDEHQYGEMYSFFTDFTERELLDFMIQLTNPTPNECNNLQ